MNEYCYYVDWLHSFALPAPLIVSLTTSEPLHVLSCRSATTCQCISTCMLLFDTANSGHADDDEEQAGGATPLITTTGEAHSVTPKLTVWAQRDLNCARLSQQRYMYMYLAEQQHLESLCAPACSLLQTHAHTASCSVARRCHHVNTDDLSHERRGDCRSRR